MPQKIVLATLGLVIALEFLPLSATAEELWDTPDWEGQIRTHAVSHVTYTVTKGPTITMFWKGEHVFKNPKLENDELTFTLELSPRSVYKCTLTRKPNKMKFKGTCANSNRDFELSMIPSNNS